jgi:diadenosine tetraphosphatase ApaH/serine/threonine PP2A family protein phosphatase
MIAVFSDIHGNLEALQAVLADIARQPVEALYCLGDTVGYGPNPLECLDLTMAMKVALLGNHEQYALSEREIISAGIERSIRWMKALLNSPAQDPERRGRRVKFLAARPHSHLEADVLFVHATPRDPLHGYLFPEGIYSARMMSRNFEMFTGCCFVGHTHVPGVFVESGPEAWDFLSPAEVEPVYRLDGRKLICNVGSVGQPRDDDWRACYVLFDGRAIRFRRVEYDVATTVKKIHAIPEIDNFQGDRLRYGR